jgi:hypothetical protein
VLRDTVRNRFFDGVLPALEKQRRAGHEICLISNRPQPPWFSDCSSILAFQRTSARQNGKIVAELVALNRDCLRHSDVVILGASLEDFLMAVNSRSFLLTARWVQALDAKTLKYGVLIENPQALASVVGFLEDKHPWYFHHQSGFLDVFSLADAGTKYETDLQLKRLATRLQLCLKDGHPAYKNAFRLHLLSSLYATDLFKAADIWAYYPSSDSANNGQEIMTHFSELARTTFGRRHGLPLFIRHTPSVKRHFSSGDRNDPTSQLETVHLNGDFRSKLAARTVVVMDDYLTRGVSFGVSAALLRAAGAAKVVGVSMGKFGNSANVYEIEIGGNVFAPLEHYTVRSRSAMTGAYEPEAKLQFLKKFRHSL